MENHWVKDINKNEKYVWYKFLLCYEPIDVFICAAPKFKVNHYRKNLKNHLQIITIEKPNRKSLQKNH